MIGGGESSDINIAFAYRLDEMIALSFDARLRKGRDLIGSQSFTGSKSRIVALFFF